MAFLKPQGVSSFWRAARIAFERMGERDKADAAHYFERVYRFRERLGERRSRRLIALLLYLADLLFLRLTTAYGTSLSRLFSTWALVVGGFGSIYYLLSTSGIQLFDLGSPGLQYPFGLGRAVYFSVITFTTLGYGDIRPLPGLGSALTAAESVVGSILMALTVVMISRRFMR